MKILVTGSNGYIGRHVIKELAKTNHKVIAVDLTISERIENVQYIISDILDKNFKLQNSEVPDVILHLAWRNGFMHNADSHIEDLSNHFRFLKYIIGLGVKHVCIMGSMHEVGYFEGSIDENTICNPQSLYAIAKNTMRQSMELYCKEKNVLFQWIRGFYIFGDDIGGNSIFAKLQSAHLNADLEFPFTSGKNKFDFISIQDLAKQITAVITQDKITGIINCCSGEAKSLSEQVEWYIKENKLNIKLKYGAYPDRLYDSPAIWGDNRKILLILKNGEN